MSRHFTSNTMVSVELMSLELLNSYSQNPDIFIKLKEGNQKHIIIVTFIQDSSLNDLSYNISFMIVLNPEEFTVSIPKVTCITDVSDKFSISFLIQPCMTTVISSFQ